MLRSAIAPALTVLWLCIAAPGCQPGPAAHRVAPPKFEPEGQSKCNVRASPARPLIVEWPAADRASLEARLSSGLVAVRAKGCEIEVLRQCTVPGSYAYRGLTRKNDQVVITDADELYAQLPIGAARLEGKLARSGKLDVRMALVGMLEAPAGRVPSDRLSGDCHGATHVIAGVQLGAFEFFAGGSGEIGAGLGVGGAGIGGSSTASRELLSADGDPGRCDASTTADARPPEGCGAVIRIELARLAVPEPARVDPVCPSGSSWDGSRCLIAQTHCPAGARMVNGQCVASAAAVECPKGMVFQAGHGCVAATAGSAVDAAGDAKLCQETCRLMSHCKDERPGQELPTREEAPDLWRVCDEVCSERVYDERMRREARQCLAKGCDSMTQCMAGRLPQ